MGLEGPTSQPELIDLPEEDRIKAIDEIVIPPFKEKGRYIEPHTQEHAYRYYGFRRSSEQGARVIAELHKLRGLIHAGFEKTALLYIKDHPEVIDFDRKIHIQPKTEDLLKAVGVLTNLITDVEEVYQATHGFKVNINQVHLKSPGAQPVIVLYVEDGASLDEMVERLKPHFEGFEPYQGTPPRYNNQEGPILYSTVGDGYLKFLLGGNREDIFRYYDKDTNFARPRPEFNHYKTRNPLVHVTRPLAEGVAKLHERFS